MAKHVTLAQLSTVANGLATKSDARFQKKSDVVSYTLTKASTADTGYSATYQLFAGSTAVGDKINIPKDMVVESGDVKTVTTDDTPYTGAVVGDKYIDLVIANKTNSHIYIPVTDLIDIYTAGNGINITNNSVAIAIDGTNAHGLSVGASGLALAEATTSASGAMSSTDKAKLDNADVTAYTAGNGVDITSHEVSAVVDSSNANGLSVGANGLALAAATTTTAGAMSASDKDKLDSADVTAYTAGNGINISSHAVSATVDSSNANGLSVGSNGIALAAATTSTAGAMSAADKTKLDGFTEATNSEVQDIIDAIWAS